jgi:hypothetical protein
LARGVVRRNLPSVCRSITLVALLAALAVAVAASAAARPPTSKPGVSCRRHPGHTLAQSDSARVYSRSGAVYGCAVRHGAVYKLGSSSLCIGTSRAAPVALAGRLVAYGLETCGVDTGSTVVIVRRLTDGKRLHDDPATVLPNGPESYQTVHSLVLNARGDDAWISTASSLGSHATATEVHEHGTNGFGLLDSGTGIDPGSLRLKRSKLTWLHGGKRRSATLG